MHLGKSHTLTGRALNYFQVEFLHLCSCGSDAFSFIMSSSDNMENLVSFPVLPDKARVPRMEIKTAGQLVNSE